MSVDVLSVSNFLNTTLELQCQLSRHDPELRTISRLALWSEALTLFHIYGRSNIER